ncbi:MAG: LysR substrate-binding domain-containing protein [Rikenellaceae bacterium]
MMTDFRLLVFVTTARELSFTRAAVELNISQPAVTKHIKELERLLSTPLFRRSGNRISLSDDGERLLPIVESILGGYRDLTDAVSLSEDGYSGHLRLGASSTITQYILPDILARFRESYPRVTITLVSGNSEEVLAMVEQGRVDMALVEDANTQSSFHYDNFRCDRVVLVSASGKRRRIEMGDIAKLPLVLRENGSGTLEVVLRELQRHDIVRRGLNVVMQIGSSEGIVRYLKASKCYAFISQAAIIDSLQRGELSVVDVEGFSIERMLRFATLHGSSSQLCELFKEFCMESVG